MLFVTAAKGIAMTSPSHDRPAIDDSADGFTMFVTFIAAVLIVTGSVGLLAIVPSWWMLVIALGIHAIGTIIVYVLVLLVVSDELGSIPSGQAAALRRAGGSGHA
jgi:hypothetical protein